MPLQAAIPKYLHKHLTHQDIPPGHRFGLYFKVWQENWSKTDSEKTEALRTVTSLSPACVKLAEALQQRQQANAVAHDNLGYFAAVSTSPFMTGIGNEHPLENGFAFLNPYGLPYLPGSSVKGILRMAAEELALGLYGDSAGWDMLAVWWLFGFEAGSAYLSGQRRTIDVLDEELARRRQAYQAWVKQADYDKTVLDKLIDATITKANERKRYQENPHDYFAALSDDISLQGALCFWDVYPQSKNLAMDILTPHHMGYFQGDNAPHDSEQPIPNVLLTIPPNSQFNFYCTGNTARLPAALQQNWQALLQTAFAYAFDWLGFGAKTAVGYGQMKQDNKALTEWQNRQHEHAQAAEREKKKQQREKELAAFSPLAQEFLRDMEQGNWQNDKNAFSTNTVIENWLEKLNENPDAEIIARLNELFNTHFPGLRQDPDKVQGKKQKPVFSDRQRKLAKKLNSLQ